jgi:hypothetical protein
MASGTDMSIFSESASINVALMIGLAEKNFIESTVIASLINANQITPNAVINSFKDRLVIYKELHREAVIKDADNESWNNSYTKAIKTKITYLQYVWSAVYGYLPQPERDNVNLMFADLLCPINATDNNTLLHEVNEGNTIEQADDQFN